MLQYSRKFNVLCQIFRLKLDRWKYTFIDKNNI